ncbi:hypothetical protein [Hymenobacter arizonensis]|uniref:hypothetical protein n=1 Tax=Hymenobacter arizonensis TaxID=1227077 RepID=UPI000AFF23CA|nr:hypothetical protein [Hymenobacter arizonensis]
MPDVVVPVVVPLVVVPEVEPLVLPEVEPLVEPFVVLGLVSLSSLQALTKTSDVHKAAPVTKEIHLRFINS